MFFSPFCRSSEKHKRYKKTHFGRSGRVVFLFCVFSCFGWAMAGCPAAYEPANLGILLLTSATAATTPPAAGLTLSSSGVNVAENGASGSYTIRLVSQPQSDVMVTVTAGSGTLVDSMGVVTLTFTTSNWDTNQTVNVSTPNTNLYEGTRAGTVSHAVTSSDSSYNGLAAANVTATISDDEKRTFVTAASFMGDIDTDNNGNAMTEADAACMGDVKKPADGAVWKAMLADDTNRRACTSADCTNPGENIDWVFKANTRYFQAANTANLIFQTNAAGIFPFGTMTNAFTGAAEQYWTGLQVDWRTNGATCLLFNDSSGGQNSTRGDAAATSSNAIRSSLPACSSPFRLLCVEQ